MDAFQDLLGDICKNMIHCYIIHTGCLRVPITATPTKNMLCNVMFPLLFQLITQAKKHFKVHQSTILSFILVYDVYN